MAHSGGVGENTAFTAYVPAPLIRLSPGIGSSVGQPFQARPELRLKTAAASYPLVGAVQHLAVDVVLALIGGTVAPARRTGSPVAFELTVLAFLRYRIAVQRVHDSRPAAP